jgi:hypothetical protein
MRPYAAFPLGWVERQLDHLAAAAPGRMLVFGDPTFGFGQERSARILRLLRGRSGPCFAETRPDVLRPGAVRAMREAGFDSVFFGVESAVPATLHRMGRVASPAAGRRYLQDALEAAQACFEQDVTLQLGMMFGYPGDTERDWDAALGFVKELRRRYRGVERGTGRGAGFIVYCSPTSVYDSTPLGRECGQRAGRDAPLPRLGRTSGALFRVIRETCRQSVVTPLAAERLIRYYKPLPAERRGRGLSRLT